MRHSLVFLILKLAILEGCVMFFIFEYFYNKENQMHGFREEILQNISKLNGIENKTFHVLPVANYSSIVSSSSPNVTYLARNRRSKGHFCYDLTHNGRPTKILKEKFGFEVTNATEDEDWDIIFGGYPHCGDGSLGRFDWAMQTGLNKKLNERGWETLKPTQIWFPCMGCRQSYCNKRGMCKIMRKINPTMCYLLPENEDELRKEVSKDNERKRLWVLKRDSESAHIHGGEGVSYFRSLSEFKTLLKEQSEGVTAIVQPYYEPYLGPPPYNRKSEIRMYLAVTSTSPLRVYAYPICWANLGFTPFSNDDLHNPCMHSVKNKKKKCFPPIGIAEEKRTGLTYKEFAFKYGINKTMRTTFKENAFKLLAKIIHTAQPTILSNIVNRGITASGAMCFSFLRADLAYLENGKAAVYEINEFPYANEYIPTANGIQKRAFHELFHMIGIDQPPIHAMSRENYEMSHKAIWRRIF